MKQLVGLFVLCLMTSVTSVFAQVSTAKWQPEPIKIDGNGSDWGMLPRFFNTETNLKYEFRNDSENLYFVLKASDQLMQMQLIKAGFSLKFKLKNANLDKVEISFKPNITEANQIGSAQNGVQARLVDKFSASPEAILSDTVYLDGFKYTKGMITNYSVVVKIEQRCLVLLLIILFQDTQGRKIQRFVFVEILKTYKE